ncbi:MAG: AMIN domain-containing protein [Sulfuricurvum sp.]|nr:AMIN domain-containing protein [Sulfuricurvum sp.]
MTYRGLLLPLLFVSSLTARENPFFAADPTNTKKITSNIPDNTPKLSQVTYTLPDQARLLKDVTYTIQNLDGTIDTQTVQINQLVNWHAPLIITQGTASASLSKVQKTNTADFKFLSFEAAGHDMVIKTTELLARHFTLSNPNRIVLDFKKDIVLNKEEKVLNLAPFVSVSVENHAKFIRAEIVLDGRYSYTLKKNSNFITIKCK